MYIHGEVCFLLLKASMRQRSPSAACPCEHCNAEREEGETEPNMPSSHFPNLPTGTSLHLPAENEPQVRKSKGVTLSSLQMEGNTRHVKVTVPHPYYSFIPHRA